MVTSSMKPSFRVFATRGEAVSFTFFTIATSLIGITLVAIGFTLEGAWQFALTSLGLGLLAALLPIVADTLINRRELAHTTIERQSQVLDEVRGIKAEAVRETQAAYRHTLANTSNIAMGLECAFLDERTAPCNDLLTQLILTEAHLTVMMNYSPKWIRAHWASLVSRAANDTMQTTFVFLDPRTDAFRVQAQKQGEEHTRLAANLAYSLRLLREIHPTKFRTLGHKYFHVHQAIVSDRRAAVCGFFSAGEKQPSPVFFYGRTDNADDMVVRLHEDVRRVIMRADSLDEWFENYARLNPHFFAE